MEDPRMLIWEGFGRKRLLPNCNYTQLSIYMMTCSFVCKSAPKLWCLSTKLQGTKSRNTAICSAKPVIRLAVLLPIQYINQLRH
jgi:hypothetical protein